MPPWQWYIAAGDAKWGVSETTYTGDDWLYLDAWTHGRMDAWTHGRKHR